VGSEELGALLGAFAPALNQIDTFGERLAKLGGGGKSLKSRVVGPRIEPLVRAAFERIEGKDRLELVEQVARLVGELDAGGLKDVLTPAALLRFATAALVRTERKRGFKDSASPDHAGYRALRNAEHRVSLAFTVVELALRVSPERPAPTATPAEIVSALGGLVGALPAELRGEVVELDLGRVERAVTLLEHWWDALAKKMPADTNDVKSVGNALHELGESKFFHVTRDEGALLRFALEARVVGEIFPEAVMRSTEVRSRLDTLEAKSNEGLVKMRRGRADAGWRELLGNT
jgi:hypothetical protein